MSVKENSKKTKGRKRKLKNKGKNEALNEEFTSKNDTDKNLSEEKKKLLSKNKEENNLNDDKGIYPLKEIEPLTLITIDEDDGKVD